MAEGALTRLGWFSLPKQRSHGFVAVLVREPVSDRAESLLALPLVAAVTEAASHRRHG